MLIASFSIIFRILAFLGQRPMWAYTVTKRASCVVDFSLRDALATLFINEFGQGNGPYILILGWGVVGLAHSHGNVHLPLACSVPLGTFTLTYIM